MQDVTTRERDEHIWPSMHQIKPSIITFFVAGRPKLQDIEYNEKVWED